MADSAEYGLKSMENTMPKGRKVLRNTENSYTKSHLILSSIMRQAHVRDSQCCILMEDT